MTPKAKLTRAERKALRPAQILDAAFEEFVTHGFTAARVGDIAERIGVTKGTVYVYFPTKDELFTAMLNHIAVPLEDLVAETRSLTGTCTERLQRLILLSYEKVVEDRRMRELMRFVVSESSRFPQVIDLHHTQFVEPLMDQIQRILDEGIASGEFRKSPAATASVIAGPVLAMMIEHLIFAGRQPIGLDTHITGHLDLVMAGLRA